MAAMLDEYDTFRNSLIIHEKISLSHDANRSRVWTFRPGHLRSLWKARWRLWLHSPGSTGLNVQTMQLSLNVKWSLYSSLNHLHRNFSHYKKSQIYKTDQQTVTSNFRSPSSFTFLQQISSTNKFNDSALMLTMFVSRLWILSRSTWNPTSLFTASRFGVAFATVQKY